MSSSKKILFQMSGSIAAFKAAALLSKLVQAGHEVEVVASKSALQFIGLATLEGLTGRKVATDLWEPGRAMDHIHLVRWADVIVVAPASAHYINRIAQGVGDDLLTTMFLAHDFKKPFLIAPAMNTAMYLHPATQKSLATLKEWGVQILETASGVLACGEVGYGRLLDPELLLNEIQNATNAQAEKKLEAQPKKALAVLVTLGGTVVPIDGVRAITNTSTGATGASITQTLNELGFDVTCLAATHATKPAAAAEVREFRTFDDLARLMRDELMKKEYAAVIHCAAVSDYYVEAVKVDGEKQSQNKIPSGHTVTLEMRPNPKLINHVREWSRNKNLKLVAFKMTNDSPEPNRKAASQRVLQDAQADFVVLNDVAEVNPSENKHPFFIFDRQMMPVAAGNTRNEMAMKLSEILTKELL